MENKFGTEKTSIVQWAADRSRLLKIGLRNKDEEQVWIVLDQVAEKLGRKVAESFFVMTVNRMINEENFSFVDPD